eukprot:Em0012g980a
MHREDRAVEGLILKYWRQHKNTGVILTYLRTVHHVAVGATVMMLLAVMDPAGSRQRRMRRLQRRRYWNQVTSSDLHVFVCNLGVAKLQSKLAIHKTSRGPGAGTVAYKAPEMFRDSRRSTPVDIYSFGCVIIKLFTDKSLILVCIRLLAFIQYFITGKMVWGELDTCQITCKILGTQEDDPQTPSCEEVPDEHREICARSIALADRPSYVIIMLVFVFSLPFVLLLLFIINALYFIATDTHLIVA